MEINFFMPTTLINKLFYSSSFLSFAVNVAFIYSVFFAYRSRHAAATQKNELKETVIVF